MQVTVDLKAIVEAMESQDDGQKTFINLKTGELVLYTHEEFGDTDYQMDDYDEDYYDDDEIPSWQKESYDLENDILGSDDYLPLPDLDESNLYHLMEQFCHSLPEGQMKDQLTDLVQDDGKYDHFVTNLEAEGLADQWLQFRENAYFDIARDWCEENGLEIL